MTHANLTSIPTKRTLQRPHKPSNRCSPGDRRKIWRDHSSLPWCCWFMMFHSLNLQAHLMRYHLNAFPFPQGNNRFWVPYTCSYKTTTPTLLRREMYRSDTCDMYLIYFFYRLTHLGRRHAGEYTKYITVMLLHVCSFFRDMRRVQHIMESAANLRNGWGGHALFRRSYLIFTFFGTRSRLTRLFLPDLLFLLPPFEEPIQHCHNF